MNRSWPSLIAGALLVLVLALYMMTFQVRFTEVAVLKTFGKAAPPDPANNKPGDVITEPGLYAQWPWPIQDVKKYDNRIQLTSTIGEETPTRDGKPIIVTTAIGWRIKDAYQFNRTCGGMKEAEERLKTLVRNDQKTVISRYDFHQFVSTQQDELQYDKIEKEILAEVGKKAANLFGINVLSIGIEKLALPQRITETVFEAMRQERKAMVAGYTSAGESKAKEIKATADGIADTILSFTDRQASAIVNKGLEQANTYNATFSKDPALAVFLLKVENLPKLLKERMTTLVFDQNSPLLDLLFSMPATTQPAERRSIATSRPGDDSLSELAPPEMIKVH